MYTFPLKYNKIQGRGHAFIFGASFLRFCIKVRLMINSRKCILQNVKNKKCKNIFPAFFLFFKILGASCYRFWTVL